MSDYTSESASHFCRVCGAWWLCSWDGTWQLRSERAGEDCCNNQPMHGNVHLVSVRAALEAVGNIASRGEIDRLRAENAGLRKDAERWRVFERQQWCAIGKEDDGSTVWKMTIALESASSDFIAAVDEQVAIDAAAEKANSPQEGA